MLIVPLMIDRLLCFRLYLFGFARCELSARECYCGYVSLHFVDLHDDDEYSISEQDSESGNSFFTN